MDNTKLHTVDAVGDHTIGAVRILTDQGIQIAGCYVPGTERNNEADAAELVRRWNAYPELVARLEKVIGHIQSSIDTDDDAYILDMKTCNECAPHALRNLLETLAAAK